MEESDKLRVEHLEEQLHEEVAILAADQVDMPLLQEDTLGEDVEVVGEDTQDIEQVEAVGMPEEHIAAADIQGKLRLVGHSHTFVAAAEVVAAILVVAQHTAQHAVSEEVDIREAADSA